MIHLLNHEVSRDKSDCNSVNENMYRYPSCALKEDEICEGISKLWATDTEAPNPNSIAKVSLVSSGWWVIIQLVGHCLACYFYLKIWVPACSARPSCPPSNCSAETLQRQHPSSSWQCCCLWKTAKRSVPREVFLLRNMEVIWNSR